VNESNLFSLQTLLYDLRRYIDISVLIYTFGPPCKYWLTVRGSGAKFTSIMFLVDVVHCFSQ